jgi:hypothetical protein
MFYSERTAKLAGRCYGNSILFAAKRDGESHHHLANGVLQYSGRW